MKIGYLGNGMAAGGCEAAKKKMEPPPPYLGQNLRLWPLYDVLASIFQLCEGLSEPEIPKYGQIWNFSKGNENLQHWTAETQPIALISSAKQVCNLLICEDVLNIAFSG